MKANTILICSGDDNTISSHHQGMVHVYLAQVLRSGGLGKPQKSLELAANHSLWTLDFLIGASGVLAYTL